jgi:hypothetical protein
MTHRRLPLAAMPRYLDPKNDLVFKKIFGEHPNLLMDFLNALLPLPADGLIVALEYLALEQIPVIPGLLKRGIVDVKCRDQQGRTLYRGDAVVLDAGFPAAHAVFRQPGLCAAAQRP